VSFDKRGRPGSSAAAPDYDFGETIRVRLPPRHDFRVRRARQGEILQRGRGRQVAHRGWKRHEDRQVCTSNWGGWRSSDFVGRARRSGARRGHLSDRPYAL